MNDFSEMRYGQQCLRSAWHNDDVGGKLKALLNDWYPDLGNRLEKEIESKEYVRTVQNETYLLSVSEHGDENGHEDKYGRLSMWRAYGGDTNVAFIFNTEPFFDDSTGTPAICGPVLYADQEGFDRQFLRLVSNLKNNNVLIKEFGQDALRERVLRAIRFAVMSTKHPGFSEEREWRVLYFIDQLGASERIKRTVKTIAGVPQIVYEMALATDDDPSLLRSNLIDRIIVGPTQYPQNIIEAFVEELVNNNIADAGEKVTYSGIPLRR